LAAQIISSSRHGNPCQTVQSPALVLRSWLSVFLIVGLRRYGANRSFTGHRGLLNPNLGGTDTDSCRRRTLTLESQRDDQRINNTDKKAKTSDAIEEAIPSLDSTSNAVASRPRVAPPFIPMQDIPRGILHGVQALFSYTEMLGIM